LPGINKFNTNGKNPVVLLSPLDWGLGHTTRCIPVIHELLRQHCTVIIACNPIQKSLLMQEFPQLGYVDLPGYDLRYGKKRWGTILKILLQVPTILTRINNEKAWLNIFLQQQPVDIIISDNRFGLYVRDIYSIFITHQLYIKTGLGRLANRLVQWLNYRRINRFNECWVPDFKGNQSLAGQLSNPAKMPRIPVRYLGGLSRLQPCTATANNIDLLIILSGPEPQRTLFENTLLAEIDQFPGKVVLVRGLPGAAQPLLPRDRLTVYQHAPATLINTLLCEAGMVISRSGYTTVMDLLALRKKSILVPTPGQAEQEYLAVHLQANQLAYTVSQAQFSLMAALQAAGTFTYNLPVLNMSGYTTVVAACIERFRQRTS
jgi:UDP-N-acetylglucosamine transferase subunit ALG13